MEIQGRIVGALPETSGTSKAGKPWRKCTYILQTEGQYPKKLAFDVLNDRIAQLGLKMNEYVKVSFDVSSHEYNGKWFTGCTAWAAERPQYQPQQQQSAFTQQPQPVATAPQQPTANGQQGKDDLPF